MKVKDAIAAADAVKPNAFSEETKFQWLRRMEGCLQAEVFLMAPAQIRELDLQYPAVGGSSLRRSLSAVSAGQDRRGERRV